MSLEIVFYRAIGPEVLGAHVKYSRSHSWSLSLAFLAIFYNGFWRGNMTQSSCAAILGSTGSLIFSVVLGKSVDSTVSHL